MRGATARLKHVLKKTKETSLVEQTHFRDSWRKFVHSDPGAKRDRTG